MNKKLELEAEEYANQINKNWFGMKLPEKNKDTKKDFIAGAKSKYVKKQKLEFAIKQLEQLKSRYDSLAIYRGTLKEYIDLQIKQLEQKLSEL